MRSYDAIIIGSGPNGLAAAICLARAGRSVIVYEAQSTIGGGARSAELTLPGFVHDRCSSVHPLGVGSPFFRQLPLTDHGLEWIQPPASVAHPLDDGTAALLYRSVEQTGAQFGEDGEAYNRLFGRLSRNWPKLEDTLLGPPQLPSHPIALAHFGWYAMRSAEGLARSMFKTARAQSLFAGIAAHSTLPLDDMPSAAFGLVLAIAGHNTGWPIPRGGAQAITNALASYLRSLGGEIVTDSRIDSIDRLPQTKAIICDITPRQLLRLARAKLPAGFISGLRKYRYGVGVYKIDWALNGLIPWTAKECSMAATVHLGNTITEIAQAERAPWNGQCAERPFVLLTQPSLFDSSRAPAGKHTAWGYCHVPNGSTVDMTERIENQIERFAPGFKNLILAKSTLSPLELEHHNANLIGGDINGGAQNLRQLFIRPTLRFYRTPMKGLYICSSSTPPGGGVHGMCGYHAAQAVLADNL